MYFFIQSKSVTCRWISICRSHDTLTAVIVGVRGGKVPDSKVNGANMGPTWVLSAPDGPHVGPMNLAIRDMVAQPTPRYHFAATDIETIEQIHTHYSIRT